jgi:hypothetical protein
MLEVGIAFAISLSIAILTIGMALVARWVVRLLEQHWRASMSDYIDADGTRCSLRQLIHRDPDWAASRIRVCEALETEVTILRAEVARLTASERSAWNAAVFRDEEIERLKGLLGECAATLEMWADVAPAVSLARDIRAELEGKRDE